MQLVIRDSIKLWPLFTRKSEETCIYFFRDMLLLSPSSRHERSKNIFRPNCSKSSDLPWLKVQFLQLDSSPQVTRLTYQLVPSSFTLLFPLSKKWVRTFTTRICAIISPKPATVTTFHRVSDRILYSGNFSMRHYFFRSAAGFIR